MKKWDIIDNSKFKIQDLKLDELIKILLANRGILGKKEKEEFLNPSFSLLTIEKVDIDSKQLQKTTKRIEKAIKNKEQIIVFGDYDVDGITGSAILWETLYTLGASVMPYIPSRIDEGYGLSEKGITTVSSQIPNIKLIITVDNGIVAHQAVEFANKQGIDVIVTDHHVAASELPKAHAIVHTTKLCGAGVSYLLSRHLKQEIANIAYDYEKDNHLELACLGTIADLVPLTGANRIIVTYGLKKLCQTKRKGLLELFKEAACDASSLGVYHVGYIIAPRINASGRLYSAMDSLRLLCTPNSDRAYELAAKLGETNKERQDLMKSSTLHASDSVKKLEKLKKILVVGDENYAEGVIGLIAGRLVEEYYRPSIVFSIGEKFSKASVRSVQGFNVIEFLRAASDLMVNVGGHPMAAGFTIETEKLALLQERLEKMADDLIQDEMLVRTLRIDCELPLELVTAELYTMLQRLGPFGMNNPEPTFVSRNVEISDMRVIGKDKKHVKLQFGTLQGNLDAIAFGMAEKANGLTPGNNVDVVYTIDENTWNGNTKLQLKVKDINLLS